MSLQHDSPEWREVRNAKLSEWVNDGPAESFLLEYFHFCEIVDDLVDGDKPVSHADLVGLIFTAFVELPTNVFYQNFSATLAPAVVTGVNAWLDSNEFAKRTTVDDRIRAFMLRDHYMEIVALVIYLLHGPERLREISMEARAFFQAETFEEYLAKLAPPDLEAAA